MKEYLKSLLWPLVAVILYVLVQSLCAMPVAVFSAMNGDTGLGSMMGIVLLISSLLTAAILLWVVRPLQLRGSFRTVGCSRSAALCALASTLLALLASDIVNEQLQLPNYMESLFTNLSRNLWGILAIAVAGPVCEEIVFRGSIMRPMLRRGIHPWAVILTSALVFSLAHGNPAQMPFAFAVGIVFGIIYLRTRSLVLTTVCHILNNSASVLLMNIYGAEADELTFTRLWGQPATYIVLAVSVILCIGFLRLFWKQTSVSPSKA